MNTFAERAQEALDSIWADPSGASQYPIRYQEPDGEPVVSFNGRDFLPYPPPGWKKIHPVEPDPTPITD